VDRPFNTILRRRFPPGTPESLLRESLIAQGFTVDATSIATCTPKGCRDLEPPRDFLSFAWGPMPCSNVLTVEWSADAAKKITHIEGGHYYACL
jgi:hypothetical protein